MASIQDMAVEIARLTDQVKFLMEIVSVTIGVGHPLDPKGMKKVSLPVGKLYQELKSAKVEVSHLVQNAADAEGAMDVTPTGTVTGTDAGSVPGSPIADGQAVGSSDPDHA